MRRPYLTHAQAETLARLFYGLGLRHHRGIPLRNQNLLLAALYRRFLIDRCGRVTVEGAAALRKYINHYGTRVSGVRENAA